MQRTLKRELKVLEIVKKEPIKTWNSLGQKSTKLWFGFCFILECLLKGEREREEILFFFLFSMNISEYFVCLLNPSKLKCIFCSKVSQLWFCLIVKTRWEFFFFFVYKKEKNKWNPFFIFLKGDKKSGFLPIFEMLSIEDQTIISRSKVCCSCFFFFLFAEKEGKTFNSRYSTDSLKGQILKEKIKRQE